MGSTAYEREMSTLPMLLWSMALLYLFSDPVTDSSNIAKCDSFTLEKSGHVYSQVCPIAATFLYGDKFELPT